MASAKIHIRLQKNSKINFSAASFRIGFDPKCQEFRPENQITAAKIT